MTELVFLDTETTGLVPDKHSVWEIAYAVGLDGDVKHSLVSHDMTTADPAALHFNHFIDRTLGADFNPVDGLRFEGEVKAALQGATLVGANPAFDAAFLFARWGEQPWHYRLLDVESYAMPILGYDRPQGLHTISKDLQERGFEIYKPDHSARADVLALRDCYKALVKIASGFEYAEQATVIG
jgi:DNA polymerase III epsilon subunit-like protein